MEDQRSVTGGWAAVDGVVEPLARARLIRVAYDRALGGARPSRVLRPVVARSWERSESRRVSPDGRPPIVLEDRAVRQRCGREPLAGVVQALAPLVDVVRDAGQVLVLADSDGVVLWLDGEAGTVAGGRSVRLVAGASWSESRIGTNAIGTALALEHSVQIFSAEHYQTCMHRWSASAAPVREPRTGRVAAVVAVWGSFKVAHPHGLSFVVAVADMLERLLGQQVDQREAELRIAYLERLVAGCPQPSALVAAGGRLIRADPPGWLTHDLPLSADGRLAGSHAEALLLTPLGRDGYLVQPVATKPRARPRPRLELRALGKRRLLVGLAGREFECSGRHSEILVILAHHPDGLSEAELVRALYRSPREGGTVRAEVCRLRRMLGPIMGARPYRLHADVRADFLSVQRLVERGRLDEARRKWVGGPLPGSDAPGIEAARRSIEAAIAAGRSEDGAFTR